MSASSPPPSFLRAVAARCGVDASVFFAVLARVWQFASGPVTLVLLTFYFSPEMRGYYYTFGSLLALQVFFELSLHYVLINVTSHEWSRLSLQADGSITGNAEALSRLSSLLRSGLRWFGAAGLLFVLTIGASGAAFLSGHDLPSQAWLGPWLGLVLLTGVLLALQPLTCILEGCDQLAVVNRYRLRQTVTGSLLVWLVMFAGFGLWATVAASAVRLFWEVWLNGVRYRRFFRSLLSVPGTHRLHWSTEVWPLQWRMALQGVATWAAMYLFNPVIMEWHGEAEAGRMGMTWNIVLAVQSAASAWIETRRPLFGQLVARREFSELDRQFRRAVLRSMAVLVTGLIAFVIGLLVLRQIDHRDARRIAEALLDPLPVLILCGAMVLFHIPHCIGFYVRAWKRDPFLVPSLMACSMIAAGVLFFGRWYGALGAIAAWSACVALISFPSYVVIWLRVRREWQRELSGQTAEEL